MLNVVKKLGSLGASLTLFGAAFVAQQASAKAVECAPGFTCYTQCPAAAPGTVLKEFNCRCKKRATCVPVGVCNEEISGTPTGATKPCECRQEATMAEDLREVEHRILEINAN